MLINLYRAVFIFFVGVLSLHPQSYAQKHLIDAWVDFSFESLDEGTQVNFFDTFIIGDFMTERYTVFLNACEAEGNYVP